MPTDLAEPSGLRKAVTPTTALAFSSATVDDRTTLSERYAQLVETINHHNYRYYVLDAPEVADAEYDQLMQELRAITQFSGGS